MILITQEKGQLEGHPQVPTCGQQGMEILHYLIHSPSFFNPARTLVQYDVRASSRCFCCFLAINNLRLYVLAWSWMGNTIESVGNLLCWVLMPAFDLII